MWCGRVCINIYLCTYIITKYNYHVYILQYTVLRLGSTVPRVIHTHHSHAQHDHTTQVLQTPLPSCTQFAPHRTHTYHSHTLNSPTHTHTHHTIISHKMCIVI